MMLPLCHSKGSHLETVPVIYHLESSALLLLGFHPCKVEPGFAPWQTLIHEVVGTYRTLRKIPV